jgi:hypothetical protein
MSLLSIFSQADSYDYSTMYGTDTTTMSNEAAAGIAAGTVLFALLFTVIIYVVMALALSQIFKKAGVEGWKAWVPFYNNWVMLELGGQKGYWAVLALIPVVNIVATVFMFIAMYHIGLKLGKPGAFVLLAIFLPFVWIIWLAVDKSTWQGTAPVAATPQPVASTVPNTTTDQSPSEPTAPTDQNNQPSSDNSSGSSNDSTPPTV